MVSKVKLEIVKYGDPVLERECDPVTEFTPELATLADDMFDAMHNGQGVGLAAPQVGKPIQLTVIDTSSQEDTDQKYVLINPKIVLEEGEQIGEEGCLSIPGFVEEIKRPQKVKVKAQDLSGEWKTYEVEALQARVFCHEIDHLHGILFLKHLSFLKRDRIKRRIRKLRKAGEW